MRYLLILSFMILSGCQSKTYIFYCSSPVGVINTEGKYSPTGATVELLTTDGTTVYVPSANCIAVKK